MTTVHDCTKNNGNLVCVMKLLQLRLRLGEIGGFLLRGLRHTLFLFGQLLFLSLQLLHLSIRLASARDRLEVLRLESETPKKTTQENQQR